MIGAQRLTFRYGANHLSWWVKNGTADPVHCMIIYLNFLHKHYLNAKTVIICLEMWSLVRIMSCTGQQTRLGFVLEFGQTDCQCTSRHRPAYVRQVSEMLADSSSSSNAMCILFPPFILTYYYDFAAELGNHNPVTKTWFCYSFWKLFHLGRGFRDTRRIHR